ncbi:MAG: hypothetical protein ACRET6_05600 [Burkholderiales bacterium]
MSAFRHLTTRPGTFLKSLQELTAREQQHLTSEIVKVRGLMSLLMKQRNTQRWTHEERRELAAHLRRLSTISPYLVVLALPGGLLVLPALAWWLDRRRNRNRAGPAAPRA